MGLSVLPKFQKIKSQSGAEKTWHSVPPAMSQVRDLAFNGTEPDTDTELALASLKVALHPSHDLLTGTVLLVEGIASAQIEGYNTTVRNLALSNAGAKTHDDCEITLNTYHALLSAVKTWHETFSKNTIVSDHSAVMKGYDFAGKTRTQDDGLVYIGGDTLDEACYVPPPAHMVPPLLDDWCKLSNRMDIGLSRKIGVSHAQFESIHRL